MKIRRVGFSIRYKLLLLLTSLPLISLTLYLFMATRLFERDKIAYVFDSSVAVSHSLGVETRMTIDSIRSHTRPMLETFVPQRGQFAEVTADLFQKQTEVNELIMLKPPANPAAPFEVAGRLTHKDAQPLVMTAKSQELASRAYRSGQLLSSAPMPGYFLFAERLGEINAPNTFVQMTIFKSQDLAMGFTQGGLYSSFLLDHGEVVAGPAEMMEMLFQSATPAEVFNLALASQTPEGTGEFSLTPKQKMLMSYSKVPIGDMTVVSVVDKNAALQAVQVLVLKSLMFFIALLTSTAVISLFASVKLTSALTELFDATQKVAQGKFDIQIKSQSNDEIGGLADGFNLMAKEVSRLMVDTAEKARMANELATVKTVQETLFPEARKQFGAFEIVGHFEPASECGGDWWNYSLIGDKLYCWIGDATGHGAPAALITGAARSAAAIIEMLPNMTPAKALQIMNRAIGETSKSKILMTFFICSIDLNTGVMTYSNASHDPPYIVKKPKDRNAKASKKDLQPLMDGTGPRLGDQPRAVYRDVVVQLEPDDMLLFYTDGIIDLQGPDGVSWGERTFIKSVLTCMQQAGVPERMESLKNSIRDYRKTAQLVDDITVFMCHYKLPTAGTEAA